MLVNTLQSLLGHPGTSDEEHRLLSELSHIDRQLRTKSNSRLPHQENKQGADPQEADDFYDIKECFAKDEYPPLIYNAKMEYFSQICNEEIDDDSLFDPHNNFLAPPKPYPQHDSGQIARVVSVRPERKDLEHSTKHQFSQKLQQSQTSLSTQSQILKERNYVYKKEVQNRVLPPSKLPLAPKICKNNGNKSSTLLSKVEKSKQKGYVSKQQINTQDRVKKDQSKQKYIARQAINQQKFTLCKEENQFKFHTFEAHIETNPSQDNLLRKNQKCKHQQFDKDSLQCTFKPTILKKSSEMVKSTKSVVQRLSTAAHPINQKKPYQKLSSKQPLNKSRIQQLSQPRKLKTQGPEAVESVPSFRPSLSKKSLEQMSNCLYDVATRNQLWLEQRQEKISRLRQQEERERQKRQDCTYSPSLCAYKGDNAPNLSRFGRQGMANYFQRLSTNNKSSKAKLNDGKENRQSNTTLGKENFISKGGKKQRYDQAVKELHDRIMGLKI